MSNNKMKVIRFSVVTIFVLAILLFGITFIGKKENNKNPLPVVMVGLPKGQEKGLNIELEKATQYEKAVDYADSLVKEGKIEEAIVEYNKALSQAKFSGDKAIVFLHMADMYEKKRAYNKALELMTIVRDKYVNDWAKEPDVERVLYLQYATNGDYDLAVEHAQKALEADAKLPNRPAGGRQDYIERLNDLKAAKDHILSQKKK